MGCIVGRNSVSFKLDNMVEISVVWTESYFGVTFEHGAFRFSSSLLLSLFSLHCHTHRLRTLPHHLETVSHSTWVVWVVWVPTIVSRSASSVYTSLHNVKNIHIGHKLVERRMKTSLSVHPTSLHSEPFER